MGTPKLSDDELKQIVAQCLSNNERAWEQFFREIYGIVRYSVQKVGLRGDDAEDAISEVCTQLIAAIDQVYKTRKPLAYIGAISRYTALRLKQRNDSQKSKLMEFTHEDSEEQNQPWRSVPRDQATVAQAGILRDELLKAYQQLPPASRHLLRLKYVDEFCYDEIAYIDGRASGALRVAVHRAIKDWRGYMSDEIAAQIGDDDTAFDVANLMLPAEEDGAVSPELQAALQDYLTDESMTAQQKARVELELANNRYLREAKVRLERAIMQREDVRGHCAEAEIPPQLLGHLMQAVRQQRAL